MTASIFFALIMTMNDKLVVMETFQTLEPCMVAAGRVRGELVELNSDPRAAVECVATTQPQRDRSQLELEALHTVVGEIRQAGIRYNK
jgi:hypothetical protein